MILLLFSGWACSKSTETDLVENQHSINVATTMQANDFYSLKSNWASTTHSKLLQNGNYLKGLIKETHLMKSSQESDGVVEISLSEAMGSLAKSSTSNRDEVIKLVNDQNEEKYVTLKIEFAPITSSLKKGTGASIITDETEFYLVWHFEQFYAQEDADNNILYPVSVPAVNLTDSTQKATVVYHADGSITWEFDSTTLAKQHSVANSDLNQLVIIEAIGIDPGELEPEEPGSAPFVPQPIAGTHLMITSIRLGESGDGSGNASELQLFMDGNDDYSKETSKKMDFFFDNRYYLTKPRTTENKGSDGRYYKVVDVNTENYTYSFNGIEGGSKWPSDKTND